MAIVKMKKFTLFAFESQKETLLEELQKFGGVQFINLQISEMEELDFLKADSEGIRVSSLEEKQSKVKFSIELLSTYKQKEKGLKAIAVGKKSYGNSELHKLSQSITWKDTYEVLKNLDSRKNEIINERVKIQGKIQNLKSWIGFDASFGELEKFKECKYLLGSMKKESMLTFKDEFNDKFSQGYMEEVNEGKEGTNVLLIVHNDNKDELEDLLKNYAFAKINIPCKGNPKHSIQTLEDELINLQEQEQEVTQKIKNELKSLDDMHIMYDYFEYELNKSRACTSFVKTDKILVLEGWVSEPELYKFEEVIKDSVGDSYYLETREPTTEDNVPILLKNNKFAEPYELITSMYSLPLYTEVDPTAIMAPFFFIFFGMMLSDFGYGFVMFVASILAVKLLPLEEGTKKFMKLFTSISISTMAWGIIYGSYFGDAPKLFTAQGIKPLWLDPSLEPMSVLLIAGIMGIIHLYTGLGIKAYEAIREGKYLDALFDVGFWYLTLTGAMLLLGAPAMGMAALGVVGKYMAIIGAAGLVATQGRANKGIGGKIAGGLFGLYGITGYLGDILSYSRLLALGLATGLIGSSFNLMIKLLGHGAVAWIFGIVIFIGGHIFNLAINALGAYVHACRLQYLEFFGKFYDGGGKAFTPFRSKNKYINIIND